MCCIPIAVLFEARINSKHMRKPSNGVSWRNSEPQYTDTVSMCKERWRVEVRRNSFVGFINSRMGCIALVVFVLSVPWAVVGAHMSPYLASHTAKDLSNDGKRLEGAFSVFM